MKFEWDERKNQSNIRKHKIDFSDAAEVFDNPMLIWSDNRYYYGEWRLCGIGIIRGRIIKIAYTESEDSEVIRIISVRKANNHEKENYKKTVWNRLELS